MRTIRVGIASVLVAVAALSSVAFASDKESATAEEVVQKVREAAAVLAEKGDDALPMFNEPTSPYVWKDSYIFVVNCDTGVVLAHPIQRERVGKPIADGPTHGGVTAAERAQKHCAMARQPGGGWWAYEFTKPGGKVSTRKVSHMLMVEGSPWVVGAGVYDKNTPVEDFHAVSHGNRQTKSSSE